MNKLVVIIWLFIKRVQTLCYWYLTIKEAPRVKESIIVTQQRLMWWRLYFLNYELHEPEILMEPMTRPKYISTWTKCASNQRYESKQRYLLQTNCALIFGCHTKVYRGQYKSKDTKSWTNYTKSCTNPKSRTNPVLVGGSHLFQPQDHHICYSPSGTFDLLFAFPIMWKLNSNE